MKQTIHMLKKGLKPTTIVLVFILILATWLRLDFLTSVRHQVSHDTIYYDQMVRQLLEKGIYGYKSTLPNAQVAPGYPLFMAAVYKLVNDQQNDPYPVIRYLQAMMSVMTIYLAYLTARRLGNTYAGLLTAALMAVYPSFVWTSGAILTETLAALLLILYVYLQLLVFEKKTVLAAILAGLAIGATVLTRPEFLVLIGASYALYYLWHRSLRSTMKLLAYTLVGAAIVLSPWLVRNIVTLHQPIVAATQVNPFASGTYPNKNYDDGLIDRKGMTQMEVAKARIRVGFTKHTWTYVKWYTIGKLKFIYGRMFYGSGHSPYYAVIPFKQPYHLAILYSGLVSCLLSLRKWRQPATLIVVILGVITVTRLAFVPEYRYNFTAMPLIILMASLLYATLWDLIRKSRTRKSSVTMTGGVPHGKP